MLSSFPHPSIQVNRGFLITGAGKSKVAQKQLASLNWLIKNGIPLPAAIITPPPLFSKPHFATSDKKKKSTIISHLKATLCEFFSYLSCIQERLDQSDISLGPGCCFPDLPLASLAPRLDGRQENKRWELQVEKHGLLLNRSN